MTLTLVVAAALQETCQICFDEVPVRVMRSARCRHLFCLDCWRGYVANAINSGPSALNLRCPLPECSAAVSPRASLPCTTEQPRSSSCSLQHCAAPVKLSVHAVR